MKIIIKVLKNMLPHEITIFLSDINSHLNKLKRIYLNDSKFASSGLDNKLSKYLNYKNGFYVELGAHDGVFSSNTYFLQKKSNWTGLLIEPSLDLFFKCVNNRGNLNIVLNYACVAFGYKKKFVEMIYSGAMTVQKNKNSDIKDPALHAKQGMRFVKNYNQLIEFCSRAKTLNQILIDNDIRKKIDFLSIDTEGVEIEVLKGLDFDEFKFKFILIESRGIDKIIDFLKKKQYVLEEQLTEIDFLFINKNY